MSKRVKLNHDPPARETLMDRPTDGLSQRSKAGSCANSEALAGQPSSQHRPAHVIPGDPAGGFSPNSLRKIRELSKQGGPDLSDLRNVCLSPGLLTVKPVYILTCGIVLGQ